MTNRLLEVNGKRKRRNTVVMDDASRPKNTSADPAHKPDAVEEVETSAMPGTVTPQTTCPSCGVATARAATNLGGASPSYVYAIGRIEPHCPSLAVEKEYSQVKRSASSSGMSDRQVLQRVLSDPQYRYLARQHCWVFCVQGIETYILIPRDPGDYELLIQSIRPEPKRRFRRP